MVITPAVLAPPIPQWDPYAPGGGVPHRHATRKSPSPFRATRLYIYTCARVSFGME
jgi:hypothetical protein